MSNGPSSMANLADYQELFLGKKLGSGIARDVYEFVDPAMVVKVARDDYPGERQNVAEWLTWECVEYTELAKWFAPCVLISKSGSLLLQKRTQPVSTQELPTHVPSFFTDLKLENWGRLGKRVVCHDYGSMARLITVGLTSRLRKADW